MRYCNSAQSESYLNSWTWSSLRLAELLQSDYQPHPILLFWSYLWADWSVSERMFWLFISLHRYLFNRTRSVIWLHFCIISRAVSLRCIRHLRSCLCQGVLLILNGECNLVEHMISKYLMPKNFRILRLVFWVCTFTTKFISWRVITKYYKSQHHQTNYITSN